MIFEPLRGDMFFVINQSDHRDGGGRIDNASRVLIIQRNISARHWRPKRATCFCYSFNRFTQLPEIFRLVRIAEIQAIRHSQRARAGAGEISRGFGNGDFAALARVERAISRIAICGSSQDFVSVTHKEHRGIRTRFYNRAGAHGVIVLSIDPVFGCNCRITQQLAKRIHHRGRRDLLH